MASRGHIPPSVMRQEVSVSGTHAPSGREHLLDFVYELAQMDRLREHLGIFGRLGIGVERDRGKAGDDFVPRAATRTVKISGTVGVHRHSMWRGPRNSQDANFGSCKK